jgi:lipoprotein NlpD
MRWCKDWRWWMLLAGALWACGGRAPRHAAPPPGRGAVRHVVRSGETLYGIGLAYGVPYQEIARTNGLKDPSRIYVGQRLRIPAAKGRAGVAPAPGDILPHRGQGHPRPASAKQPVRRPKNAPGFGWPVPYGTVTSGFGPRNGTFHDGIDISAPIGAAVRAAADGEVAYCASLPGYGKVIILRHGSGYATIYAHNERQSVREGQRVRRGQLIATVGRSGRTTGPNLHFEIRRNNVARDPLDFLPASQKAQGDGAWTDGGG